ncbi:hypothetical protein [Amaricoccus macauensis]|uniref:hypothetical protein n=1 Tax=Amaricoccus macauensis TaxID=57001 RepID=UPI003C7DFE4B
MINFVKVQKTLLDHEAGLVRGCACNAIKVIFTFTQYIKIKGNFAWIYCNILSSKGERIAVLKLVLDLNSISPKISAPTSRNTLKDLVLDQGTGEQIIRSFQEFSGGNLTYSLNAGKDIASIDASSGLLRIRTDDLASNTLITVVAQNLMGSAEASFHVTVKNASGIGYWEIENTFLVS